MTTNEILNFIGEHSYFIGGFIFGASAFGLAMYNKTKDSSSSNKPHQVMNISQLLTPSKEVTSDKYTLRAKVDTVFSNSNGYAGVLFDNDAKMPFCLDSNDDAITDATNGALLYQSQKNGSELEFRVELYTGSSNGGSRVVDILNVSGMIDTLKYEPQ